MQPHCVLRLAPWISQLHSGWMYKCESLGFSIILLHIASLSPRLDTQSPLQCNEENSRRPFSRAHSNFASLTLNGSVAVFFCPKSPNFDDTGYMRLLRSTKVSNQVPWYTKRRSHPPHETTLQTPELQSRAKERKQRRVLCLLACFSDPC